MSELKLIVDTEGNYPAMAFAQIKSGKYKCVYIHNQVGFADYVDGKYCRFATQEEEDNIVKNNLDSEVIQHFLTKNKEP